MSFAMGHRNLSFRKKKKEEVKLGLWGVRTDQAVTRTHDGLGTVPAEGTLALTGVWTSIPELSGPEKCQEARRRATLRAPLSAMSIGAL